MRLTKPRVAPLSDAELTPEQSEALEPMRTGFRASSWSALSSWSASGAIRGLVSLMESPEKMGSKIRFAPP